MYKTIGRTSTRQQQTREHTKNKSSADGERLKNPHPSNYLHISQAICVLCTHRITHTHTHWSWNKSLWALHRAFLVFLCCAFTIFRRHRHRPTERQIGAMGVCGFVIATGLLVFVLLCVCFFFWSLRSIRIRSIKCIHTYITRHKTNPQTFAVSRLTHRRCHHTNQKKNKKTTTTEIDYNIKWLLFVCAYMRCPCVWAECTTHKIVHPI